MHRDVALEVEAIAAGTPEDQACERATCGRPTSTTADPGPPHELWFAHRRIAFLTLDAPRPVVDVASPSFVALNELSQGDTNLLTQPALETT